MLPYLDKNTDIVLSPDQQMYATVTQELILVGGHFRKTYYGRGWTIKDGDTHQILAIDRIRKKLDVL